MRSAKRTQTYWRLPVAVAAAWPGAAGAGAPLARAGTPPRRRAAAAAAGTADTADAADAAPDNT